MSLRVLSLWQPWASLTVLRDPWRDNTAPKQWETRHWRPKQPLPIPVVIHATKKATGEVLNAIADHAIAGTLSRCGISAAALPFGYLIGVARVEAVEPTETLLARWGVSGPSSGPHWLERRFGNYEPGRFGWKLVGAQALPRPIAFRGRQDVLYELSSDVEFQINVQLGGGAI